MFKLRKSQGWKQQEKTETSKIDTELKSSLEFTKTTSDHIAVFITNVFGSMGFLVACMLFFIMWISWNLKLIPGAKPFDPFPFTILTMIVSLFAVILSISVLISQNRQGRMEKIRQQIEFEVNVRAENEVTKVLTMLHEIHQKLGLETAIDIELEKMKEPIDLQQLHQTLNEKETGNDI